MFYLLAEKPYCYFGDNYRYAFFHKADYNLGPFAWYDRHDRIVAKCTEHFGPSASHLEKGRWCSTTAVIGFRDERDAVLFRMKIDGKP